MALILAIPASAQYHGRYPRGYVERGGTGYSSFARSYGMNPVYFGMRLGVTGATVSSDDPLLDGGSAQSGLSVGLVTGVQVSPVAPLFLETGLMYVEKGGKGTYEGSKFTYDLNYIEVPFLVKYGIQTSSPLSIQPFLGCYLALGVGGKMKNYANRSAESSFSSEYFKRFDAGLKFGCGVQYNILYGELGYDLGLTNISHDTFDTAHTGCFYANIGLNF